jgi:elongation factor G
MSIEPLSKSDEGPLREALDLLIRTDPSLHLDGGGGESGGVALGSIAASTGGQMVLSGMGELHLEIARDRLTNEFNARAHLGDVRVSYRETIQDRAEETSVVEMLDRDMMGQRLKAECRITIRPLTEDETMEAHHGGNMIVVDEIQSEDGSDKDVGAARDDASDDVDALRRAMQAGLLAALSRGPMSGNPLTGLHVRIDSIKSFGPAMSPAKAFSLLGAQALRAAVKQHGAVMMEPFMNVRISCDEISLGKVVGNLTSAQNGIVERVDHAEDANTSSDDVASDGAVADVYLPSNSLTDGLSHVDSGDSLSQSQKSRSKCTIIATVPLVHLVRYSSTLRALTRGMATYEMSFSGFAVVTPDRQKSILTSLGRL